MGSCISSSCQISIAVVCKPSAICAVIEQVHVELGKETEELNRLRRTTTNSDAERIKKQQVFTQTLEQQELVESQLAENENNRRRRDFEKRIKIERHLLLARREEIRQCIKIDFVRTGLYNVMDNKKVYEKLYKDWRIRNGVKDIQRTRKHYHHDGSVSIKTIAGKHYRRHHRKKPH